MTLSDASKQDNVESKTENKQSGESYVMAMADMRYDEGLRIRKEMVSPCICTRLGATTLSGQPLIIEKKK